MAEIGFSEVVKRLDAVIALLAATRSAQNLPAARKRTAKKSRGKG